MLEKAFCRTYDAQALGPVTYISTLCGKFIQRPQPEIARSACLALCLSVGNRFVRNGISVTSVISSRPLDLFKRHPNSFLVLGAGNVTLKK